jgi:hypothetical protein
MNKTTKLLTQSLLSSAVLFAGAAVSEEAGGFEPNMGQALPNAKPGECYAKVMTPAEYKTETKEITKREGYEKIEIVPAKYETVVEKVLVRQASEKLVPVPAVYAMQEERIEIEPTRLVWQLGNDEKSKAADSSLIAGANALGLPEKATAGQCFTEYHKTAEFKTETQKVLKKEASRKFEIIPAQYETIEEKIMVSEASEKLIEVPAEYETITEKVLEHAAYTEWKTGRGPVERIDNGTGEIMCLVEIPAKYKTIKKRILKSPSTTRKESIPAKYIVKKIRKLVTPASEKTIEIPAEYEVVSKRVKASDSKTTWAADGVSADGKTTGQVLCMAEIPAKFKTVKKRVVKTPASIKKVEIPAVYQTQKVRKLITPPQEKRIKIPAEKQTISKRVRVASPKLEWQSVLCETNMTSSMNLKIQNALKGAGFDPGVIDGVIGQQTLVAVDEYQRKNNLPTGGLTMRTLKELGVNSQ